MPSLVSHAVLVQKSDSYSLSVRVTHNLVLDHTTSDPPQVVHARKLAALPLGALPSIAISLTASAVTAETLRKSALAHQFRSCLTTNAAPLGIVLAGSSDGLTFQLSTRLAPVDTPPRIVLHSIQLEYTWKPLRPNAEPYIFSPSLLLPDAPVLDTLTHRLISSQLVARYPLVFGPWAAQLAAERDVFPSLIRSILCMTSSSLNVPFRDAMRALIKRMRSQLAARDRTIGEELQALGGGDEKGGKEKMSDADVLIRSLTAAFQRGLRPQRFKSVARVEVQDEEPELVIQHYEDSGSKSVLNDAMFEDLFDDCGERRISASGGSSMTLLWNEGEEEEDNLLDLDSDVDVKERGDTLRIDGGSPLSDDEGEILLDYEDVLLHQEDLLPSPDGSDFDADIMLLSDDEDTLHQPRADALFSR